MTLFLLSVSGMKVSLKCNEEQEVDLKLSREFFLTKDFSHLSKTHPRTTTFHPAILSTSTISSTIPTDMFAVRPGIS